jgi:Zn finger protein HypA/HybF involved in hydrogenase expression
MERIIQSIQERIAQEKITEPVAEVALKVGMLEVHSEEAAKLAFQVLAKGTPLENSRLRLTIIPAFLGCPACGYQESFITDPLTGHDPLSAAQCPKCHGIVGITGGRGVESIDLILSEPGP